MLLSIQPLPLRGWFKIKSPHFIFASGLILFRGKDYILLAHYHIPQSYEHGMELLINFRFMWQLKVVESGCFKSNKKIVFI